ncbi:MAG TPA: SseB family protein [Mycobacteriales bacterium]|nr:SseB family protein [Mycobacteriales bacterium]
MPELPRSPAPDDGTADLRLAAAGTHAEVLAALAGARVYAAVAATATTEEVTEHGLRAESTAEMAVLVLEASGQRALPVFSSVLALQRWRLDARPVPLTGPQACQAALDEGACALVIDPGGPAVVLEEHEVRSLASGFVPVPGSGLATRRADVELRAPAVPVPQALRSALQAALAGEGLRAARLLEGPDGLVLGIAARTPLGPADLAALAQRVVVRLGSQLPPDGLDLVQVPPRGAGVVLLRRTLRRGR